MTEATKFPETVKPHVILAPVTTEGACLPRDRVLNLRFSGNPTRKRGKRDID